MKNKTQLLTTILILALSCYFQIAEAQWSAKSTGCSVSPQKGLFQMKAVDNKVAWALTYLRNDGFLSPCTEITRTTDGGKHWTNASIPFPEQIVIGHCPLNATTDYVISYSSVDGLDQKVLRTTDGGSTWTELFPSPNYPVFWQNIQFFNSNDGIVYGDSAEVTGPDFMVVFITHDGGNTWSYVPDEDMADRMPWESFYPSSSTAIGDTVWTVSTNARVWRSADKGQHWIANATDRDEAVVSNIKMRDAMHGLWGVEDELYRTSDGGITWQEVEPQGTFFTFDLAYVPGTASTWVSTGGDTSSIDYFTGALHGIGSSYSLDDGNTWITIDTGVDHLGLTMINSYTGYCGGFNQANGNRGVFTYSGPALGYTCGNNKTAMCFKGQSYCVPHEAIQRFLNHGAQLGECYVERINNDSANHRVEIYPNPFSTSTTIAFSLPQSENVSLKIFDAQGRFIHTLANEIMSEGSHSIMWDARDENGNAVSEGIYFLRMETENEVRTTSIAIVK